MASLIKYVLFNELIFYEGRCRGTPRQDANRTYFKASSCPNHGPEPQADSSETSNRNSLSENAYGIFRMDRSGMSFLSSVMKQTIVFLRGVKVHQRSLLLGGRFEPDYAYRRQ